MESAGPGAYSAPPCSASTSCGTARRSTWGRASADGTDLTREGRRQIEVAAELFAGIRLDLVVASPLRRAMGTAGIIAARQHLTVEPIEDLREIAPGPIDGMELAQVFARVLEFFSSPEVTWDTPFVGGETFRQLRLRVLRFVVTLLARPGWTNALAVASRRREHGALRRGARPTTPSRRCSASRASPPSGGSSRPRPGTWPRSRKFPLTPSGTAIRFPAEAPHPRAALPVGRHDSDTGQAHSPVSAQPLA